MSDTAATPHHATHQPTSSADDILARFSPATRTWFTSSFPEPTPAQLGAWDAISTNQHALVVAPTGSGKTLSAFLWAIDQLVRQHPARSAQNSDNAEKASVKVLYISPLKALASDIERNLTSPLIGIGHAADRLEQPIPEIRVGTRTGDTPANERRAFTKNPPDIYITTPESLFLILTSKARESLSGVHTIIIDEIHAMAGTKRGAHLALSLERLDHLTSAPVQRIGLSATVEPVDEVAAFLAGARPVGTDGGRNVAIVRPPSTKEWNIRVEVPVEDLSAMGQDSDDLTGNAAGQAPRTSIWPHVEKRLVDIINPQHNPGKSTLVFTNGRRTTEKLTARINEQWADQVSENGAAADNVDESNNADSLDDAQTGKAAAARVGQGRAAEAIHRFPADYIAQGGISTGAAAEIARAHHGSVSKENRRLIEEALKTGQLPAVVATSSLELGIDMGSIDTVINIAPPPSVASGLQRIGRAGHQVGSVSHGIIFPRHRSELIPATVIVQRMLAGQIERLHIPRNPLDVLAQHIVAMVAVDDWQTTDLTAVIRRAYPFSTCTDSIIESLLDMVSGLYPSTEFAELKARITWDRTTDTLTARPGSQRIAVTSGGTIPDRGLFGVFLASADDGGKRVGELDEEMVYESRTGDVFTLGSSTWRIEEITHDRVLVSPAPGQPGRLPFWRGETQGRSLELGLAIGRTLNELANTPGGVSSAAAKQLLKDAGLDTNAVTNTCDYLRDQQEVITTFPDDTTIVIERFRDELGDWRLVIHSPRGIAIHAPWALAIGTKLQEQLGLDVQAMPQDDGIVLRLPDTVNPDGSDDPLTADIMEALLPSADEITDVVTACVTDSALFASRFRECAARALLLPKRNPQKRQPLWQQRQRSAQLLSVAIKYPRFPIVLETIRECLQDVYDLPGLQETLRQIHSRQIKVADYRTPKASPFAQSLLFGYVAEFLYEGDSPLAERRAAALALDPDLLNELLGRAEGVSLADLLDPKAVVSTYRNLQQLSEERHCRHSDDVVDMLRKLGPLSLAEIGERTTPERTDTILADVQEFTSARIITFNLRGITYFAAAEDAGLLRDALGIPIPPGVPEAFLAPTRKPLLSLLRRFARCHVAFSTSHAARRFGLGVAIVDSALLELRSTTQLEQGTLMPAGVITDLPGYPVDDDVPTWWCDPDILRQLRRKSLAALRAEVEPVTQETFATFLPQWHDVITWPAPAARDTLDLPLPPEAIPPVVPRASDPLPHKHAKPTGGLRGEAGLLHVVDAIAGSRIPASALETLILPSRLRDYNPQILDALCSSGEVLWSGSGTLSGNDGWVTLHHRDTIELTLPEPSADSLTSKHQDLLEYLQRSGGVFYPELAKHLRTTWDDPATPENTITDLLWDLVWAGLISNDTLSPLRHRLNTSKTAHKKPRTPSRGRTSRRGTGLRHLARRSQPSLTSASLAAQQAHVSGRWSALPNATTDPTIRAHAQAELFLERFGIVTRGSVQAEDVTGGFSSIYRVLSGQEDHGQVRRGYFIDSLGAAQFASAAAVDRLRATTPQGVSLLAATDPANPFGAALPWPSLSDDMATKHRPGRRAGAIVVIVNGALAIYLERGAKSVLAFSDDLDALTHALTPIGAAVNAAQLASVTVNTVNGTPALSSKHPVTTALRSVGFHASPQGYRLRKN